MYLENPFFWINDFRGLISLQMSQLIKYHCVIYILFKSKVAQAANSKWQDSLYHIWGIINFAASPGDAKNSMSLDYGCTQSSLRSRYSQVKDEGIKNLININNSVSQTDITWGRTITGQ